MNKFSYALFMLIFLLSCQREELGFSPERLQSWSARWEEVIEVVDLHPVLKSGQLKVVSRPPGTWIPLAKLIFHPQSQHVADCLIFRPPQGKREGRLKVMTLDEKEKSCDEVVLEETEEELGKISELKLKFKKDLLHFEVKDFSEDQISKDIYFPNIGPLPKYERFSSSFSQNDLFGAFWLRAKEKSEPRNLIGEWDDNYRDQTSKVCHQVNKKCEEVVEYKCDRCRFGWFPVVDSVDCEKTMKICGQNLCGQKGMPACPRGLEAMKRAGQELTQKCFQGSKAGYCEKGLNTVCDGDVLICL